MKRVFARAAPRCILTCVLALALGACGGDRDDQAGVPIPTAGPTSGATSQSTTGGTEPTESTGGTEPTESTGGTDPTEHTGGTDPTEHTGGTDPTESTGGSQPTESTDTPDPTDPTSEPTVDEADAGFNPPEPGGDGLPPPITIGPMVAFGAVDVGASLTKRLKVTNKASAGDPDLAIRITQITFAEDNGTHAFTVDSHGCANVVVEEGGASSCPIMATFEPDAVRSYVGKIKVSFDYVNVDADGLGSVTITLRGEGDPAPATISPDTHPTETPSVIG